MSEFICGSRLALCSPAGYCERGLKASKDCGSTGFLLRVHRPAQEKRADRQFDCTALLQMVESGAFIFVWVDQDHPRVETPDWLRPGYSFWLYWNREGLRRQKETVSKERIASSPIIRCWPL